MRLGKFLFVLAFSCGFIFSGYYFIWNFVANKRKVEILHFIENVKGMDINYKDAKINGYPNNIRITLSKTSAKSKNADRKLKYNLGDVLFKIYPFVLEEQAQIIVPKSHRFVLEEGGKVTEFKLQTSNVEVSFQENKVHLDFSDFKIFNVNSNKLLVSADKVYYTSLMNRADSFKINATNLEYKNQKIESIQLDLDLENVQLVYLLSDILKLLDAENKDYKKAFNETIKQLRIQNSKFFIKNIKYVNDSIWYELSGQLFVGKRDRIQGLIELVSNNLEISENILKTITANNSVDISEIDLIKRLILKNDNGLVRISGELERGFLKIFNEKVARAKSIIKK